MTVIQADMAQTDPTKNNFVENQAAAQATASANAAALISAAISALNLGTAATQAASAFDATGLASAAQTAAISSASASLTAAISALASVGRTGAYSDLIGKPTLGTAAAQPTGSFATAAQGGLAASALQSETDPVASPALGTHAGLGTGAHGGIVAASDSRLSNARTPTLHATTHASGGSDSLASTFDITGAATTAQAFAIQRANQTGTQIASTISDFSTAALASVTWSTLTGKPTFANVATSGAYSDLSGAPSLGTQMSVDTGWSANSTAGDKTAVLTAFTNTISGPMVTALNLTSAGLGTAISGMADMLVLVVKKLAAHETALVAFKLPSA